MIVSKVLENKIGGYDGYDFRPTRLTFDQEKVDGVLIVGCVDIGYGNESK